MMNKITISAKLLFAVLCCAGCIREGENRLVYLNGQLQTVFKAKRLPDGRLVKVGICSTWFANSQLHQVESFDERGYPIGIWQVWNEHGQKLCEGKYERAGDSLMSVWKFFHENGSACRSEAYLNGKKHGRWLYWHNDLTLCQESHFQNDTAVGEWSFWDKHGRRIKVEEYRDGVKCNEVIFTTIPQEKK